MHRLDHWLLIVCAAMFAACAGQVGATAQGFTSGGGRPFLIGFTPVIGPGGGVGGVQVDADGVLHRAQTPPRQRLEEARIHLQQGVSKDLRRGSPMRKVSLRRLQAEIGKHIARQEPLSSDIFFLAGLQRIEYVFAFPECNDIVVAGPAEGWVMQGKDAVGTTSGDAALRLDDLLDALHAASSDENGAGITCSIDPTTEGMRRLQQMLRSQKTRLPEAGLQAIEQAAGDQRVTVTGVRPNSHFARVMVGTDFLMKRIAMDLEPSGVTGLPSYLRLLSRGGQHGHLSSPRWWLAPSYETVEKSEDSLTWRFHGRGIQALSEHGYRDSRGELISAGRPSPSGKLWADKFTGAYDQLGKRLSVFSQLRGCVDLAITATLLTDMALPDRADCKLPLLMDPRKLKGQDFAVPSRVPSQASFVRGHGRSVMSVSGGVDLDTGSVLAGAVTNPQLANIRKAVPCDASTWWWD